MTEAEWLAAEFFPPMVYYIRRRATLRQFLLLGVVLCRRVWDRLPFDDCREMVFAVERLADHPQVDGDDYSIVAETDTIFTRLQEGYHRVHETSMHIRGPYLATMSCGALWHDPDDVIHHVADSAAISVSGVADGPAWETERQAQARLLHELFGNPFRPVAFDPAWRSETAVALASGVYADRAFDRLPILADALEEAGCDYPDILAHCREPGPHAHGCWVVDLVLNKA